MVTSPFEATAGLYGRAPMPTTNAYARATEFAEVVVDRLWGSSDGGNRIDAVRYHGAHVDVDGALNIPRTPEGKPVAVLGGCFGAGSRFRCPFRRCRLHRTRYPAEGERHRPRHQDTGRGTRACSGRHSGDGESDGRRARRCRRSCCPARHGVARAASRRPEGTARLTPRRYGRRARRLRHPAEVERLPTQNIGAGAWPDGRSDCSTRSTPPPPPSGS